MDLIITLLIIIAAGVMIAVFLLLKKSSKKDESNSLLMLQQQINHIAQVLDSKLSESNKSLQQQFSQSADIIRNVTEKLTRLDETNKQVIGFADQLRNLQDILKNPKQRGILGEYYLETLLKNVFAPGMYKMQYEFRWYKSVDDGDYKLQFRPIIKEKDIEATWQDVPFILEGVGERHP